MCAKVNVFTFVSSTCHKQIPNYRATWYPIRPNQYYLWFPTSVYIDAYHQRWERKYEDKEQQKPDEEREQEEQDKEQEEYKCEKKAEVDIDPQKYQRTFSIF